MHRGGELAGQGDGGAFEADPFLEPQPPCPEIAFRCAAGEDDCRSLKEKPSQMAVAPSGYVPSVVDLP